MDSRLGRSPAIIGVLCWQARVAQTVEQRTRNAQVRSSILLSGSTEVGPEQGKRLGVAGVEEASEGLVSTSSPRDGR